MDVGLRNPSSKFNMLLSKDKIINLFHAFSNKQRRKSYNLLVNGESKQFGGESNSIISR
jgi:hypothetical protein